MIKRIELIIQSQNLTPSQFADRIGIQRSGLSHILSGRNNPSLDFVQKVLTAFPELNPAWFLQGKGRMYDNLAESGREGGAPSMSFFDEFSTLGFQPQPTPERMEQPVPESGVEVQGVPQKEGMQESGSLQKEETNGKTGGETSEKKPKIRRILLFYEDGTFEEYTRR